MLAWQVPRACRMSWSSLTAAAASSPQHISGSITSSIRPTPTDRETQRLYQTQSTKDTNSSCVCTRVKKQHLLCWDLWESDSVHHHGDSFHCLAQAGSVWLSHSWSQLGFFCDLQNYYRPACHSLLWEPSAEWSGSLPKNPNNKLLHNYYCSRHQIWNELILCIHFFYFSV